MAKKLTYENAYLELQQILEDLQNEKISIDRLATNTKRAKELLEFCKTTLRNQKDEVSDLLDDQ